MQQPPAAPAAGSGQGTGHCPAVQAGGDSSDPGVGSELASAACAERTPSNGSPTSTQSQQHRGQPRQLQEMQQPYGGDNSNLTAIEGGRHAEQLLAAHKPGGPGPLAPQGVLQLMQPASQARQSAPGVADGAGTGDDEGEEEVAYPQEQVGLDLLGAVAAASQEDGAHCPSAATATGQAGAATASSHGLPAGQDAAGATAAASQAAGGDGLHQEESAVQGGSYGNGKSSSGQRGGRQTGAVANSGPAPLPLVCQVPDCGVPLIGSHVSPYFRRHRVCVAHAKADAVNMHGKKYRFCQQCGVLHPLEDFDGQRKSCRVQLDKHNLRRRCRRKSQTPCAKVCYDGSSGAGRAVGPAPLDPYGGLAQAYALNPAAWGAVPAALQQGGGSMGWGRGVSEDTRDGSRDRDEGGAWPGDAADSGPLHSGYGAWGYGAGSSYDPAAVYAAGMAAAAAMRGGGAGAPGGSSSHQQAGWGVMVPPPAAATAHNPAAAAGWHEGSWDNPAPADAAGGPPSPHFGTEGTADTSYAAALAAATAAAASFRPGSSSGPPAAPAAKGSSGSNGTAANAASTEHLVLALTQQLEAAAAQRQQQAEPQQQQQQGPPSRGAPSGLDPAVAAAAQYTPAGPAHSGQGFAEAAAAAVVDGAGRMPRPDGSKGDGSSSSGASGVGLQQLRLCIAAAIAAGKGPGLTGLRDLGFVQQLLIVDELAHGVLAEMQRDPDNAAQQQQQQQPAPTAAETGMGSVCQPGAGASTSKPLQHSASQQMQGASWPQQQQEPPKEATPQPHGAAMFQQQQQAASPIKQEEYQEPTSPPATTAAAEAAGAAISAAAPGSVPPAALAALMEQIAKFASSPSTAATAAAAAAAAVAAASAAPSGQPSGLRGAQGAEQQPQQPQQPQAKPAIDPALAAALSPQRVPASPAAAAAAAAAGKASSPAPHAPGSSSSRQMAGVKRESPATLNMVPLHKRPKPADASRQSGSSSQGLRRPVGAGAAAPAATGPFRPAARPPSSNGQQQQQQAAPGVGQALKPQQQLQQQLQGLLSQSGNRQAAHMLTQLLQQLAANGGGAGAKSKSPPAS